MSLRRLVLEEYKNSITNMQGIPEELRRALIKNYERTPVFVDNLVRELSQLPYEVKRETIQKCVQDMVFVFVLAAKRKHDEALMSEVQRLTLQRQQQEIETIQKAFDEAETNGKETENRSPKGETYKSEFEI